MKIKTGFMMREVAEKDVETFTSQLIEAGILEV